LDRLTKKWTLAGFTYHSFDKSGQRTQITYPDQISAKFTGVYYTYDASGRMTQAAPFDANGNRPATYQYDKAGLPQIRALYGNNVMAYYFYDNAARLSRLENRGPTFATLISYFSYGRDANGNATSITHESGLNTYYSFDALDRMTEEAWKSGSTTLYGFAYNFDAASNRTLKQNEVSGQTAYYTYNNLNLMTKEWIHAGSGNSTNYYAYDSSQRMTKQYSVGSGESHYFTYDQRNEIKSVQDVGGSDSTRYFSYNGAGERVVVVDGGATPTSYWTYDRGNLVSVRDTAGGLTQYRRNDSPMIGGVIELRDPSVEVGKGYPGYDSWADMQKVPADSGASETNWQDRYGVLLAGTTNFTNNQLPFLADNGLAKLTTTARMFVGLGGTLYLATEGVMSIGGALLGLGPLPPMVPPLPDGDKTPGGGAPVPCCTVTGYEVTVFPFTMRQAGGAPFHKIDEFSFDFKVKVTGTNLDLCHFRQWVKLHTALIDLVTGPLDPRAGHKPQGPSFFPEPVVEPLYGPLRKRFGRLGWTNDLIDAYRFDIFLNTGQWLPDREAGWGKSINAAKTEAWYRDEQYLKLTRPNVSAEVIRDFRCEVICNANGRIVSPPHEFGFAWSNFDRAKARWKPPVLVLTKGFFYAQHGLKGGLKLQDEIEYIE
jgi:YD repeat-containing protein